MSSFASEMFRATAKVAGGNPKCKIRTAAKNVSASIDANVFADTVLEFGDIVAEERLTGTTSEKTLGGKVVNRDDFTGNALARVCVAILDEGQTLTRDDLLERYSVEGDAFAKDTVQKERKPRKRREVKEGEGEGEGEQVA